MGVDWRQARYSHNIDLKQWITFAVLYKETAINIGYSCKLLTEDMKEVLIIDAEEQDEVLEQLKDANEKIDSAFAEFEEKGGQSDTTVRQTSVALSF